MYYACKIPKVGSNINKVKLYKAGSIRIKFLFYGLELRTSRSGIQSANRSASALLQLTSKLLLPSCRVESSTCGWAIM